MPKRASDWIDTSLNLVVASGAQGSLSLMTGVAPVNVRRQTLVRTIIGLQMNSTTVAGAWGTQIMDLGIGITSQEAFAAGALPDPVTAGDQPSRGWVFRQRRVVAQNGNGSVVLYDIQFDIRAARKLDDGECFIVIDNTAGLGTAFSVVVTGMVRQLWLLP